MSECWLQRELGLLFLSSLFSVSLFPGVQDTLTKHQAFCHFVWLLLVVGYSQVGTKKWMLNLDAILVCFSWLYQSP
jgi:hypothetical protein